MKRAWLLLGLLWSAPALAHGGLPVSQAILRQAGGDTLYVPVLFWGLWVGAPSQPWRWICEEEINANRTRRYGLSTDGTFYATDIQGVTISRDHGCTWIPTESALAGRYVTDVAVDPVDGQSAWFTTGDALAVEVDGGFQENALYVTHDGGQTATPTALTSASRRFDSVNVAKPAAQPLVVYATSISEKPPFSPIVHLSIDGGQTFEDLALTYLLDTSEPYDLQVLAIDPRDANVVYVRAFATGTDADGGATARQALLRSRDGGQSFSEIWKMDGVLSPSGLSRGIDGVAVDVDRGRVFVATAAGLLAGDDAGSAASVTLAPQGALSQAQCVDSHGGDLLVCSSNYKPDFAAVARSSDGAQTFQSLLQYVDTEGPVDCPKGTPVGDLCPLYWQMYGSQLGIGFPDAGPSSDAGLPPKPTPGCGCRLVDSQANSKLPALLLALGYVLLYIQRRLD